MRTPPPAARARRRAAAVVGLAVLVALLGSLAALPRAGAAAPFLAPVSNPADPANPTNPLAGRNWGVYMGSGESPWAEYNGKLAGVKPPTAAQKKVLRTIVETPKARWFSDIMSPAIVAKKVANTIDSVTSKDPDALVQLLTFGMVRTWEWERCPNTAAYKRWSDAFTGAVRAGHAHTSVIVQNDGPLAARCVADRRMVRYTVDQLSQIPDTTIYIEMGSADWPAVVHPQKLPKQRLPQSATMLKQEGVGLANVRGFALDTSHFDATAAEVKYGKALLDQLARMGIPGKHFVVDTSDNGKPFTGAWWRKRHPRLALDQAKPCRTRSSTHCLALGIPPTTDVADPVWKLPPATRTLAAKYVDAFLWVERPWLLPETLAKGISKVPGFKLSSALQEVRTSPWNALTQGPDKVIGTPK